MTNIEVLGTVEIKEEQVLMAFPNAQTLTQSKLNEFELTGYARVKVSGVSPKGTAWENERMLIIADGFTPLVVTNANAMDCIIDNELCKYKVERKEFENKWKETIKYVVLSPIK